MAQPAPDDTILRQFLLGTLVPAEAAVVERWLEANPEASVRLRGLSATDTVTDAISAEANTSGGGTVVGDRPPTHAPGGLPLAVGSYRVWRELGRGGMGVVLEAEDGHLKRRVAIKLIAAECASSPQARDRFLREARAVARIDHPNVVPVHHVDEHEGQLFLVMPLLKGETLDARLRRERKLKAAEVMRIGREVAAGLAAAHAVGLIHRDIKPANIWLDADTGRARVLDFGLAKPLDSAAEDEPLTSAGAVLGTLHYMSPQQANGESLDPRTDLFSLGAVLHHAATGERPFDGPTKFAVLYAVVNDTPKNLEALREALPARVAEVVRELLEKKPDARPKSAAEVIDRLTDAPAVVATPVPSSPLAPWEAIDESDDYDDTEMLHPSAAPRPVRWWKPVAVAAGLLVALGAAFAGYKLVFETKEGTLVVVVDDPEADVRFKGGELQIYDAGGKLKYTLKANERNAKVPVGQYTVKVAGADGLTLDTPEFAIKKDGRVTLRVTADAKSPVVAAKPPVVDVKSAERDADRRAAEWTLSVGGAVSINGEFREIRAAKDLPKEPFRLTAVFLVTQNKLTDADLIAFKGCRHVTILGLNGTPIGDAGLANFSECKGLNSLSLDFTKVTDVGLALFKECSELQTLNLLATRVTDAGLAHLKSCRKLRVVSIVGTAITDAGIAQFKDCDDLISVNFDGTAVGNAGIEALKGKTKLTHVFINGTRVTDDGLNTLKSCTALSVLYAAETAATDAGLMALATIKGLTALGITKTKVTQKGVADFAKALPTCRVIWDGGVIEPSVTSDRRAAEWVLSVGGTVAVDGAEKEIKALADLPKEPFRLTMVDLNGNAKVTDAGLAVFADCKALTHLNLSGCRDVTDTGLAHFKGCTQLRELDVSATRVTDAGLAAFAANNKLVRFTANGTAITDAGLAALEKHSDIEALYINDTKLTDAGLKRCAAFTKLSIIQIDGTAITDEGLVALAKSDSLRVLDVRRTKVTKIGADALAKALPQCLIAWDGGTIEPKK